MHAKNNTRHREFFNVSLLWVGIGFFVLSILVVGGMSAQRVRGVLQEVQSAKIHIASSEDALKHFDTATAVKELKAARGDIDDVYEFIRMVDVLEYVPFVDRQYVALDELIHTSLEIVALGEQMVSLVDTMSTPLRDKNMPLFFERVTHAQPEIIGSMATLRLLKTRLLMVEKADRGFFGGMYDTLIGKITFFEEKSAPLMSLFDVIPLAAGFNKEKTYLLLFQNNHEVRATGGFIGTYGILKLKQGEITHLSTDNIYNLDKTAEKTLHIPPPKPFLNFFPKKNRYWFLRDSNWSPDFPTAARQAEFFYTHEGGKEHIDGVIALTPDGIVSLLSIVGPVTIDGVFYSRDTFVRELQYQVEIGYSEQGVPQEERKEVIGRLASVILRRLYELPGEKWMNVFSALQGTLQEKHALLYFHEPQVQQFAASKGWDGRVRGSDGDFLMVIDSNMASLKTDGVMEKHVDYSVQEYPDGHLQGTVVLTYKNNGGFTWYSTRYKDWVRVYMPADAVVLHVQGAMKKELSDEPGPIEISSEGDKVSIGAFIVVEPGHTKTLRIEYRLPQRIAEQIKRGTYALLVQKQSGVSNQKLDLNLHFLRSSKQNEPRSFFTGSSDKHFLHAETDLRTDHEFQIIFQ